MSYKGRSVFICPNGHIVIKDSDTGCPPKSEEEDKKSRCHVCKKEVTYLCEIDDTNGRSESFYYRVNIEPAKLILNEYVPSENLQIVVSNPGKWKIESFPVGKFGNFFTGEIL